MKESELRQRLCAMYGTEIPPAAHQAFLTAASAGKEKKVKKKLRFAPVLAIFLLLALCSAAYALVSGYSVKDYEAGGNPTEEFLTHRIDIHERYENDVIALTVNDAVFDGERIALAMDIAHKNVPVYIRPKLTAEADGVSYAVDVEGFRGGDFMTGFLYPNPFDAQTEEDGFGFDGVLWNEDDAPLPVGDVTWTLTVKLYRPLFELVQDDTVFVGDENEWEEYAEKACAAYREKKLLVRADDNLVEYQSAIQPATGIDEETYWSLDFADALVEAGVMEKTDELVCRFTTSGDGSAHKESLTGKRFEFDEVAVVIDSVNATFLNQEIVMHYDFGREMTMDELTEIRETLPDAWNVYDQDGQRIQPNAFSSGVDWDVDEKTDLMSNLRLQFTFSFSGERETETLTFVGCYRSEENQLWEAPEYTFTLPLT